MQNTLEATAEAIGVVKPQTEAATICRSWVIAKEKEAAVKVAIDLLKPEVDRVRNTETDIQEYHEDGTPKVVRVEGSFRNKRGFFQITNVRKKGSREVKVEDIENLVKVGILTAAQAAQVINTGKPSSHNLVKFKAL